MPDKDKKRVIGSYGEMYLAMVLHDKGWQVYKAYIDEHIDFIIARYYCDNCSKFSNLKNRKKGSTSFPTNLCSICEKDTLKIETRFIQVKTSEGVKDRNGERKYSFHAKLRSNVDNRSFYAWIALLPKKEGMYEPHCYIFNHKEISKFDDLSLPSYQQTDNQKTTLRINHDGKVVNKGRKHNYAYFNEDFHNNFDKLKRNI